MIFVAAEIVRRVLSAASYCNLGLISVRQEEQIDMEIATWVLWQLLSYSIVSWLAFALIVFCTARCGGWWLIPLGHIGVASIIVFLDVRWIQEAMAEPGWNGVPDMDIIFATGVMARILIINTALLPVTASGIWLRQRKRLPSPDVRNT